MDYRELALELLSYQMRLPKRPKHSKMLENTKGEIPVLAYLADIKDGVAPGELAAYCDVTTARIASILNNLEKKGHITRTIDNEDRRKIIVNITKYGKKIAYERREVVINDLSSILEYLGEKDAKAYIQIMKRIYLFFQDREELKHD